MTLDERRLTALAYFHRHALKRLDYYGKQVKAIKTEIEELEKRVGYDLQK